MDSFIEINFLFIFKSQPSKHLFFGCFHTNNAFSYLIKLKLILAIFDYGFKISGSDLAFLNLVLSILIQIFFFMNFSIKKKSFLWIFDTLFIIVRIIFFFSNNINIFMWLMAKFMIWLGFILGQKFPEMITENPLDDSIIISIFLIYLDLHFNFCYYSILKLKTCEVVGEVNPILENEKPLQMFEKPTVTYRFIHPDILEIVTRIKYKAIGNN